MNFHEQIKTELKEMHKIGIIGSESKLRRALKVVEDDSCKLRASHVVFSEDNCMSVSEAADLAVELS